MTAILAYSSFVLFLSQHGDDMECRQMLKALLFDFYTALQKENEYRYCHPVSDCD
jgi:hypothetical protein